jgi:Fe-S cluster assembly iron-binding protein IscA
MLIVTDQAASAIDGILASRELPEEAGVRVTTEVRAPEDGAAEPAVQLEIVEAPEEGDQVLEDASVFVEPEAAMLLDDKLLDAQRKGNKVQFALRQQA